MVGREDLKEGLATVNSALTDFGNAIKAAAGAVKQAVETATTYNKQVVSAYYHLAGDYTFPIEREVFQEGAKIPSVSDLGPAQIPLWVVPVIPAVIISSVTWIPLIGNSVQSFVKGFVQVANMPMLDISPEKRIQPISVMGTNI